MTLHCLQARSVFAFFLLFISGVVAAYAEPLDTASCQKLQTDQRTLTAGTPDLEKGLDQGPEWAQANMKPEDVERLKQWIEIDDQLRFRCPNAFRAPSRERAAVRKKKPAIAAPAAIPDDSVTTPSAAKPAAKRRPAAAAPRPKAAGQAAPRPLKADQSPQSPRRLTQ